MPKGIVALDIEATGLNRDGSDEILQLAAIDSDGRTANRLYSPTRHLSWPSAERIHHISPSDVTGLPPVGDFNCIGRIREIMRGVTTLVGWNLIGDIDLLTQSGINIDYDLPCVDVMCDYGRWMAAETGLEARRWKLVDAARCFGFEFEAHDALEDAKATMAVARSLISLDWPLVSTNPARLARRKGKHGVARAEMMSVGESITRL